MLKFLSFAAKAAGLTYQTLVAGVMIGSLVGGVVKHMRRSR